MFSSIINALFSSQERVFMDPSMRLFEYDKKSLLASIPTMLAFPKVNIITRSCLTMLTFGHQLHDCYQVQYSSKLCL